MLEGLYQIGLTRDFNILDDAILEIGESYKYVIKIQLKKEKDNYIFYKIDFEEMSKNKKIATDLWKPLQKGLQGLL